MKSGEGDELELGNAVVVQVLLPVERLIAVVGQSLVGKVSLVLCVSSRSDVPVSI